ncbi:MAG TPA: hypothetical protein DCO67_06085 [Staphylococcus sp.]|nr:hypothetical protein [Staphylococcus sp.]
METAIVESLDIDLKVDFVDMINYSLAQNDYPIVRDIQLLNLKEDKDIENIKLKIYSNTNFIYKFEQEIPLIEQEKVFTINKPKINYNYDFFREIIEKITTHFFIEITDEKDNVIFRQPYKINILPYQHWLGTQIYPSLTCAYIVPNENEVRRVVSEAGLKMKEWTGDPSFTGYQSGDSESLRLQVAAIYASLQKENIAYKNPPASFERFGQNIRYPHEIVQYKNGTCIDLAFFFAACLEAVGIHSLIIFIHGHAFAGYWLLEKSFTEPFVSDYTALSKRLSDDIKDIDVVETISVVNAKDISFEESTHLAKKNLLTPYNFEGVVDVKCGRNYGITPVLSKENKSEYVMEDYGVRETVTDAPNTIIERVGDIEFKVNTVEKTDIWSRNLLDLTLRNPMINFRINKSSIQLMVYDVATLEDELSSHEHFKIIEKPKGITFEESGNHIFNAKLLEAEFKNIIDDDFKENRIRSFLTENALEKQLKSIYRKAKSNLDENGANSLYIAIGFLKWCEPSNINRTYNAPLLLLPLSMEKKSAGSNMLIELSDDEPQFNITLVEYLRQKFNIDLRHLIDLPKDEKGTDIPLLFSAIRKAIMDKDGWDIEEIATISNFSFSKFVMWNDLQNRAEEISSNFNIQALIKGNYKIDRSLEDINARIIEKTDKPHELSIGSSVDASQLEAIKASEESSFVLHGPPGTGKSQTITNMIIHNINKGKKVLFVAEKQAALNVVNNRLTKLGLQDFTLELHSNKTKKSRFLDKIEKSMNQNYELKTLNVEAKSNELFDLKNELSTYVEALHNRQKSGYSLYELIQMHEQFEKVPKSIKLNAKIVENLENEDIRRIKDITSIIDKTITQLKYGIHEHPLKDFKVNKYSISKKDQFEDIVEDIKNAIPTINEIIHNHIKIDGLNIIKDLYKLDKVINSLKDYIYTVTISDEMYSSYQDIPLDKAYKYASSVLITYINTNKLILDKYNEKVLNINVQYLNKEYAEIKNKIFKNKKLKKLLSNLEVELLQSGTLTEEEFVKDIKIIMDFQKARKDLQKSNDNFIKTFGNSWKGKNTELDLLNRQIQFINALNIQSMNDNDKNQIKDILNLKVNYTDEYEMLKEQLIILSESLNILVEEYNYSKSKFEDLKLTEINEEVNKWLKGQIDFKHWTLINEQFNKLKDILNIDIRNIYIENSNDNELFQLIMKDLIVKLVQKYFTLNDTLDSFNSFELEQKIQHLKDKEKEFSAVTIENTIFKMRQNLNYKRSNEEFEKDFLVLQKAIRSKGRGQSIRTIFNNTSNIIQDIFPVMLMSPLSIAQYIDPKFPKFDLVIFDEASQIPTDVAIGAISRAENCIIVGDPNQMPPTAFFSSNNIDEDNLELEDLESLLDDCLASNFPEKYLKWHYRSNHESLIHYSNLTYYNSSLFTYPSSDALTSKVFFENVNGVYKRGSHRNNEIEAKAVVKQLIKHLKSKSNDSLGVITFNIQQQNLIEDLFNLELVDNPELDRKNQNSSEPIFIKNLENVQGDERDIILFSTTFGPDENNNMTMNFGPLNKNGGWRRLNVAITRARKEMKVLSSFDPEDIDLKRTKSEGVKGLKGFLEYARNANSLPLIKNNISDEKNGIATILQEKLLEHGINSKVHLGNSEYKIDLAIVDPNMPNKYTLAILIDGENYYKSQTSNDRNIIQPSVLNSLGWEIHRIWAIDWYEDKNKEIDRIITKVKEKGTKVVQNNNLKENIEND